MCKSCCLGLTLLAVLAAQIAGQQANSATATLAVNNVLGPPYPITGVNLPRGVGYTVTIAGYPNAPYLLGASASLLPQGFFYSGGLVDLSPVGFFLLLNGAQYPGLYNTGGTGILNVNATMPATATIGSTLAVQGLIADPTSINGATLTAATQVTVTAGVTTQNLILSNDGYQNINLVPYGLNFSYYANTYNSLWVNADGAVSFNQGSGDFTPTPSEFRSSMPRIAGFWTDLDPSITGSITLVIDQSGLIPEIRVSYFNLPEWANSGGLHTFRIILDALGGNIQLMQSVFNNAPGYDVLVGISPGNNLSQAGQKDLSSMQQSPIIGATNEIFYEWFGLVTMPYYTAGFNNPWDLTGKTLVFSAVGVGSPGASYYGTVVDTPPGY